MRERIILRFVIAIVCSSCQSLEIYPPLFKCSNKIQDSYGICSHINRKGPRNEYDTRNQDLEMIKNTGATFIRTDFDWTSMATKENGIYSYTHYDNMMETVNFYHLNTLAIVTLRFNFKKSDQEEWKDYVKKEAIHYRQITHWELLNEVDIIRKWNPNIYAKDYVQLLKKGYHAIKAGNKKAKVLFSGLANSDSHYLDSILNENVRDYFDIMNVHRYNHKNSEPEEMIPFFKRLHNKLVKYHINKPVWLTECGCSTAEGWTLEDVQAKRLPRIFLISYACGVDKVFWYKSRSCELSLHDPEDFFGLWHKDYSPKPAYYSYFALTKMCPDRSTRPKLMQCSNVYIASWKRPDGKRVWALWTSKKEETVALNIEGNYETYDNHGEKILISSESVNVSQSVIYIVGARNVNITSKK